jgi:phosphate transport system substrate-binding protein
MALRALHWLGFLAATPVLLSATAAAQSMAPTGTLRIAAAATLAPLAGEVAATLRQSGRRIALDIARGEKPLAALADGEADAALVARPLDADESRRYDSRLIGHDSLLLVVHERNPLDRIDTAGARAIFARELSDWQQVGAGNSGAIVPVTRAPGSDTRRVLDRAFGIGEVNPAGSIEVGSNLAAALYVAADPQAIGYLSAGAYEEARLRGLRLKALRLDGMTPTTRFCTSGNYDLCRPLLLVRRKGVGGFVEAALAGAAGDELLSRHGFAPAPAQP